MPSGEQQTTGRELSLQPLEQLPAVVGKLEGPVNPVEESKTLAAPNQGTLPQYPSGFLESPVYQTPPTTPGMTSPQTVIQGSPAPTVPQPVIPIPEAPAPKPPTTQNPFQPSVRDHRAIEYDPSYWSQPWPTRMP